MIKLTARQLVLIVGFFLLCLSPITNAQIVVTDDFNREVVLEYPAQRIISLAPHITENLFSAGLGEKIVGVVEYSDYPIQAQSIQPVGSYVQFNLETILSLKPDLIVAWKNGNNTESLERIEGFGIPVYYSEPRSFDDILENIKDFTILGNSLDEVDPAILSLSAEIEDLRQKNRNKETVNVFYQVWSNPLMTLNGEHIVSRALEYCGAKNLFSELPIIAPRVNIEAVIEANPDVIITGLVDGHQPDMSIWEKWTTIKAVANSHYVFVDSDAMHRHTLRMLNGLSAFCAQIDVVRNNTAGP